MARTIADLRRRNHDAARLMLLPLSFLAQASLAPAVHVPLQVIDSAEAEAAKSRDRHPGSGAVSAVDDDRVVWRCGKLLPVGAHRPEWNVTRPGNMSL